MNLTQISTARSSTTGATLRPSPLILWTLWPRTFACNKARPPSTPPCPCRTACQQITLYRCNTYLISVKQRAPMTASLIWALLNIVQEIALRAMPAQDLTSQTAITQFMTPQAMQVSLTAPTQMLALRTAALTMTAVSPCPTPLYKCRTPMLQVQTPAAALDGSGAALVQQTPMSRLLITNI